MSRKNTPYTFTLDTPTVAVISLDLVLSASREVTAGSAAVVALQRYISSLPMNTYMLDDVTIERVLSPYGISLGASTLYTATIITATETRTRVNAGSINLQDIMYASSKPVIMYCFNDGITITKCLVQHSLCCRMNGGNGLRRGALPVVTVIGMRMSLEEMAGIERIVGEELVVDQASRDLFIPTAVDPSDITQPYYLLGVDADMSNTVTAGSVVPDLNEWKYFRYPRSMQT